MTGTDRLAYQRTVWALERTQLAWVRTAFAVTTTALPLSIAVSLLGVVLAGLLALWG